MRRCIVCGGSLGRSYASAATCSNACRQKAYRERKKADEFPEPTAELLERYDAALEIVPTLPRVEQRLDLLAAVIWPGEVLLGLQEAA